MLLNQKKIWLTWENHRRSRELSRAFGAKYIPLILNAPRFVRYPVLAARTVWLLIRERPYLVFCQNPSMVLAYLVVVFRPLFQYRVVVDRHSNFKFETQREKSIKWNIFHYLSRKTISLADATIVTNDYLKEYCDDLGGNAFVLQDKIPEFDGYLGCGSRPPQFMRNLDDPQVMCITMFDDDEPIEKMLEASQKLSGFVFYFTGNYKKLYDEEVRSKVSHDGSFLLGFVSDNDYLDLIFNSDVVLVLTKKEYILNCGAYEAVSLCKPVVLANTKTLREYFGDSAVYSDPGSAASIAKAVERAFEEREEIQRDLAKLKVKLSEDWAERFSVVHNYCEELVPVKHGA